ncbi:MAG: carbohydrate binding domain-containing protein [Candidatus Omnitrophica bacterium]|nr:carbohydrate binding domain-containing protein [Candidatus Omnitrophota bacterium]
MRLLGLVVMAAVFLSSNCFAQEKKGLLIDNFEGAITGGPEGTVDYGTGGDSKVEVSAGTDQVHSGKQSLKIVYTAAPGGYMWIARGFGLDSKNTQWLVKTEDIDWKKYSGIALYMYGTNSGTTIAFDLKDANNEIWRSYITDDFTGWKQVILPFVEFFARNDWQPDNADKNSVMDFPIKSYQFEPKPEAQGTVYFDDIELISQ